MVFMHLLGSFSGVVDLTQHFLFVLFAILFALPVYFYQRRDQGFKEISNRWGLFFTEKELIIREPNLVERIPYSQITEVVGFADANLEYVVLNLEYREEGHKQLKKRQLLQSFDYPLDEIEAKIRAKLGPQLDSLPPSKESEDMRQRLAWERQLREVYRYRNWLPRQIIHSIPVFPCSVEERKAFVGTLKSFQHRLVLRDRFYRFWVVILGLVNVLLGFGVAGYKIANIGMLLSANISLVIFLWGLILPFVYAWYLPKWWKNADIPLLPLHLFFAFCYLVMSFAPVMILLAYLGYGI